MDNQTIGVITALLTLVGVAVAIRQYQLSKKDKPSSSTVITGNENKNVTAIGNNITQTVIQAGTINQQVILPQQSSTVEDEYHSEPTPFDIYYRIRNSQPYIIEEVSKSYIGLKVKWQVQLYSINKFGEHLYTLTFYSDTQEVSVVVNCKDVDITKFPVLKIMNRGDEIIVYGEIINAEQFSIYLKDCIFKKVEKPTIVKAD